MVINLTCIPEDVGSIPGLPQWVKDAVLLSTAVLVSQMRLGWLGSGVAVTVMGAGSYSLDSTPSLGISTCCRCGPKNTKKEKETINYK